MRKFYLRQMPRRYYTYMLITENQQKTTLAIVIDESRRCFRAFALSPTFSILYSKQPRALLEFIYQAVSGFSTMYYFKWIILYYNCLLSLKF